MKLHEYIDSRPPLERARLIEVLNWLESLESDQWAGFCENLRAEGQLDTACWTSIVEFITIAAGEDLAYQLALHIRAKKGEYQLRGNLDPEGSTQCLTRLVALKAFVDLIVEQDPDGMLPAQVAPYLKEAVFGREVSHLPTWLLQLRLGLYIIWGAMGLPPPIDRVSAEVAACRCGLPRELGVGPIVCLRYKAPDGISVRAPTLLDAYGGWPWPNHFRAAKWNGKQYVGTTQPRADCASESGFREVVSESVPLSSLCEPIRVTN